MNPNIIREMEPHIRQRYWFALSSFARMYTPPRVSREMEDFCFCWAEQTEPAPLDCLHNVDLYFRNLWNTHKQL